MSPPVTTFLDQRILQRVRAEYLEMPGMRLRTEQLRRLCGIDPAMCTLVVDALVKAQFLSRTPDGSYVRFTDGPAPSRRPAKAELKAEPFAPTSRRAS